VARAPQINLKGRLAAPAVSPEACALFPIRMVLLCGAPRSLD